MKIDTGKINWPIVGGVMMIAASLVAAVLILRGPVPDPDPGPGPVKGYRVILVYETSKSMPKEQSVGFFSTRVDGWLDTNCEGGKNGWHRWDKDINVSKEEPVWQAIWADVKPKLGDLPQIAVIKGQKAQLYPFPASKATPPDEKEAMKFLEGNHAEYRRVNP